MERQKLVEIFINNDIDEFQESINKFIKNKLIIDIKYSTVYNEETVYFSALIIYIKK
ncbi:hypothetical protein [Helcococcus kunzii]|uniref:hypothetical protein n=1 Tax=Helcococcus kunzii TaxID=40091 RepID=UPI0024AC9D96|nr:hypothetical protein [Helcococcus kunzii]